jgi:hypothetical protein
LGNSYPVVTRRRAGDVEVHLVEDVEELYAELNVILVPGVGIEPTRPLRGPRR